MADLKQLETALVNAHRAGDTQAARTLANEIQRQRSGGTPRVAAPAQPETFDPTEGMSTGEKLLAGVGKAFVDVGRGVGNAVTDIAPGAAKYGFATRADTDEAKKLDAPLMNTGAGMAGNVVGNVAAAVPLMLVPGANTIAGGAALGAVSSALQPVGEGDSRTGNAALGAVIGGAVPATVRAAKVLRAGLVDPFTDAGRNKIVGGALNRSASNKDAAIAAMQSRTGATPGFAPTAGQAADDAGIASLERAARAIDPAGFGDIDKSQRGALVTALRSVAKTPEERAAAVAAREDAVKPLYDAAKTAEVDSDATIAALLKRPSMAAGQSRAGKLAAERGETFGISQGAPERTVYNGFVPGEAPMLQNIPAQPGKLKGTALHDLKMGLDDAIGSPGTGGMVGAERNAALGTQQEYMDWLGQKIPAYAQAKNTYASMSKPINQMDIGQELYNRFVPALADGADVPFKARADAFAQALRNGDQLARNVTGMKNITLDKVMDPAQLDALKGVVSDSAMVGAAQNAGRGVGSDTVQKMAMSNLIDQSGLPSWIGSVAPARLGGGWLRTAGDILYTKNDEAMRHLLADVLKDPTRAAEAMKAAGVPPSKYAEVLRAATQAGALGTTNAINE